MSSDESHGSLRIDTQHMKKPRYQNTTILSLFLVCSAPVAHFKASFQRDLWKIWKPPQAFTFDPKEPGNGSRDHGEHGVFIHLVVEKLTTFQSISD